jgi:hypothetical protein
MSDKPSSVAAIKQLQKFLWPSFRLFLYFVYRMVPIAAEFPIIFGKLFNIPIIFLQTLLPQDSHTVKNIEEFFEVRKVILHLK